MSDANRTAVRFAKEPYFAAAIGGAYASGTITFSGTTTDGDTVTINGVVYTFKDTLSAARHVKIGATAAATALNLVDAVNANYATYGVAYHQLTVANVYCIASVASGGTVVTVSSKLHGTASNSYTLAKSSTDITVSGANLSGGLASNYATMTDLRYTSHSLKHGKMTVESEEIRSDRTAFGMVKVGISAGGDLNHELHMGDLDELIASALQGPIESGTSTQAMTISSGVLTPAVDWSATPGILGAKYVKLSNRDAANNGIKRVISISGNALTLEGVVDEIGASGDSIEWAYSRQGVTLESYLLETDQTDSGIVVPLTGMCINEFALTMTARAKVMVRFGWLGYGIPSGTTTRTDTCGNAKANPSLNPIVNTTSHLPLFYANDKPLRTAQMSMDFSVNNNLRDRPALAREGTLVPGSGESSITGRLQGYFDSKFEYDDFLAHTDTKIEMKFVDSSGNVMSIFMPAVQMGDGSADVPGTNQDVFLNRTFKAKKAVGHDGTSQFQLQIDMLAA